MATLSGQVRAADTLTGNVLDALREAVVVVDAGNPKLPLILANAAAERCFSRDAASMPLVESSLYSWLGPATDSAIAAARASDPQSKSGVVRVLPWRFPRGEIPLSTELKQLDMSGGQPVVMLTFGEPSAAQPLPALTSSIESLPLDLLILDRELTVTHASAGAAQTAGSSAQALLNLSALVVLPTALVPREALTGALEGRHFHDDSIAVNTPGQAPRWFDVDVQPLMDHSSIVGLAVQSLEITERRGARRPGTGGDKRLFALTEFAPDVITVAGRDGHLRYVSAGIVEALGYSPAERLAHSLFDEIHPEDEGALRSRFAELERAAIASFSQRLRARHKNGSYRWLDMNAVSAFGNPLINGVLVRCRDVTDRKGAEDRLLQRDEVFKLGMQALNAVIFDRDLTHGGERLYGGVPEVLGIAVDELKSRGGWTERIHPADQAGHDGQMMSALASGREWTSTYRVRNVHGHYRSILERGLIQRGPYGDPIRAVACAVDVSATAQLTELLGDALRVAMVGGWEYSYITHDFDWTENLYQIYETDPVEFPVSWQAMMSRCPPEWRVRLRQAIAAAEGGNGQLDLELEIITLKERRIWVRLVGRIENLEGRPFRAYGSLQNIQTRKLAQIALENNSDWLKLSMGMVRMNAWRWDRAQDALEFAIVDGKRVHLPRVVPGMKRLLARVHPSDRAALRRGIEEALGQDRELQREFRVKSRDDEYRVYVAIARPLVDAGGVPTGLVGVARDVTDRYDSQARLLRSEEMLRTTTANAADTLLLLDGGMRICFINRGVGQLGIDDLLGQEYSLLLPEEVRTSVLDKLHRVLARGEPVTYEFAVNMDESETQYFENRAVLVREDGIGTGISIALRDVTERKRMEQEILGVASRERQAIGRDLHDGLGQELTGVALLLRALASRQEVEAPASVEQINEIAALVNHSIATAHDLARGLLPVSNDGAGLAGALHALAERGCELYGMKVECRVKVPPKRPLNEATANHIYRIAQEALTNAARHAEATDVEINLAVTAGKYLLRITDNGVGLREGAPDGGGMGLKIMKYRASMIGATFEILSNDPHGTVICVSGHRVPETKVVESENAI